MCTPSRAHRSWARTHTPARRRRTGPCHRQASPSLPGSSNCTVGATQGLRLSFLGGSVHRCNATFLQVFNNLFPIIPRPKGDAQCLSRRLPGLNSRHARSHNTCRRKTDSLLLCLPVLLLEDHQLYKSELSLVCLLQIPHLVQRAHVYAPFKFFSCGSSNLSIT